MPNILRTTLFINEGYAVIKKFSTDQPFTPMNEGEKVLLEDRKYTIVSITHRPESVSRVIELKPYLWE